MMGLLKNYEVVLPFRTPFVYLNLRIIVTLLESKIPEA